MRFGRLVAIVVTTTLRFVLEIVPPEPPPVELRRCGGGGVEEKAGDGEDRVAARVPGLPPCPREAPRKCADA